MLKNKILKILVNNYIETSNTEYETIVLNSILLSNKTDLHSISKSIRELQSEKLVSANFNELDECIFIELTNEGKTFFIKRNRKLFTFLFSNLASFLTGYIIALLTK